MDAASTLGYIVQKFGLDLARRGPTEIPDMGRDNLPELFNGLGYARGVEVGTEKGLYAEILCSAMPRLHLTCVDAWEAYRGYRDTVSQKRLSRFYDEAVGRLALHNCTLMRTYSMDAVRRFEDGSLDFVYIDANHMIPYVLDDICAWRKKVRSGGIVAGHDYYESKRVDTRCHVKYAVDCVARAFRIRPWFLIGTRAKVEGQIRDKARSWFWVQE